MNGNYFKIPIIIIIIYSGETKKRSDKNKNNQGNHKAKQTKRLNVFVIKQKKNHLQQSYTIEQFYILQPIMASVYDIL